ncbi:protein FAF-like, chloroplastic [Mercurialis annua]|uniref:protein FAF-like, chloroplastic n=1 Tax=Mercurialis annua TaxID=3986 RepID=UPI00215F1C28|nr:protein FAF-like, chloroplastic [Mercurialis annua]
MAACGSLQPLFDKPLPETPSTLLESLSPWNQINAITPIHQSSFTEIFGELHFKEISDSSSSLIDLIPPTETPNLARNDSLDKKATSLDYLLSSPNNYHHHQYSSCHRKSDSFSPRSYESLQLCTEGLGFESFDDVEDLKNDMVEDRQYNKEKVSIVRHSSPDDQRGEIRRSRLKVGAFPPPISCIGKSGKPWVSFKSYRHDGRFVLKQVKVPSQEFLHAHREDGRLKMNFIQPRDEIIEEGEEENYAEEEENEQVSKEDQEQ